MLTSANFKIYGGYMPTGVTTTLRDYPQLFNFDDLTSAEVTTKDFADERTGEVRTRVSICVMMKSGNNFYLPLDTEHSSLKVGDKVDLNSIVLKELSKPGSPVIDRADGVAIG